MPKITHISFLEIPVSKKGNKCWIGLLDLNDQIYPWEAGAWVGDKEHRRTNPELNVRAASEYSGVRKQGV